jgi:hypothetical protein
MWSGLKKTFQKLDLLFFKIFIKIEKKLFPKRYLAASKMINLINIEVAMPHFTTVQDKEGNKVGELYPDGVIRNLAGAVLVPESDWRIVPTTSFSRA